MARRTHRWRTPRKRLSKGMSRSSWQTIGVGAAASECHFIAVADQHRRPRQFIRRVGRRISLFPQRHRVERRQQWRGVLVAAGLRPNVGLLATTPSRPRSHDSRFANPSACKFFATGGSPHNCDVHGAIRDDRSVGWVRGQTSGRSALFHSSLQAGADPYLLDGTVRISTSIARHPALRARLSRSAQALIPPDRQGRSQPYRDLGLRRDRSVGSRGDAAARQALCRLR